MLNVSSRRSRRVGRLTGRLTGGLAVLVAGTVVFPGAGSGAPPLGGFVAAATADGGRVTFTVNGFAAVEDVVDGGGAVAQSVLDPQGAVSFASLPHPGDLAIAGPGLFNAVTGQHLPGGYPFYVQASHPAAPEAELADPSGTYRLAATAGAARTDALSQFRGEGGSGNSGGSGGTRSVTSGVADGEQVTVTARTRNEALALGGGALRIASVRSQSVTAYRAGAPGPVTTTELVVEGGEAGGHRFAFGPDGLVVAGQGIPLPAGGGLAQLNAALAPAGIQLHFAAARDIAGGATAGAVEIRLAGQAPVPGTPPGIVRFRFGGATTSVVTGEGVAGLLPVAEGLDPAPPSGIAAPPSSPSPPDPGGRNPAGEPPAAAPVAQRTAGGGRAAVTGVGARSQPPPAGSGDPAAAPAPGTAPGLAQPILVPRDLGNDGFVFGTLMAGGVVLLALSLLWRAKGLIPS